MILNFNEWFQFDFVGLEHFIYLSTIVNKNSCRNRRWVMWLYIFGGRSVEVIFVTGKTATDNENRWHQGWETTTTSLLFYIVPYIHHPHGPNRSCNSPSGEHGRAAFIYRISSPVSAWVIHPVSEGQAEIKGSCRRWPHTHRWFGLFRHDWTRQPNRKRLSCVRILPGLYVLCIT